MRGGSSSGYLASSTSKGAPFTAYPYSYSFWFYRGNTGYISQCLVSISDSTVTNLWGVYISSGTSYFYTNNSYVSHGTGTSVGWYFYSLAMTSTFAEMRINSSIATTSSHGITITDNLDRWGVFSFLDSTPSHALESDHRIADFAVWNTNLSSTQTSDLYSKKASPLTTSSKNLVAYAPLNDGDGSARDIIGGRHMTETNTVYSFDTDGSFNYKSRSFMVFKGTSAVAAATYNSIFHGGVF